MQPPAPDRPIRLPLQVGITSLWSLARCSTALIPGLVIIGFGVYATIRANHPGRSGVGIVFIGVMLVIFAAVHGWLMLKSRPSDVSLSKEGIVIEGGPHSAKVFSWAHVNREGSCVEDAWVRRITLFGILRTILTRDAGMGLSNVRVLRLELALRDRPSLTLAEAERPLEQESLRALLDTIQSDAWTTTAEGKRPAQPTSQNVLCCPQCGGAVAPDDKPLAACRYCNHQVPIPGDIQERVRAARQVTSSKQVTERLILGLLEQPGAGRTNTLLLLLGAPMMLVWPLALAIGAVRGLLNTIEPVDFLFLALFPLAVILALFTFLRAKLTDRQALRLLTLNFGAREPARAGDPYTCRRCSAPLPDAEGKVVVGCAFCGAENVLGLDLRREAKPSTEEAQGLESALAQRNQERRLWGVAMAAAGLLLVVALGSLALGLGAGPALGEDMPPPAPTAEPAKPTLPPTAKPASPPTSKPAKPSRPAPNHR